MNPQALLAKLQDKRILFAVIGVAVAVVVLIVVLVVMQGGSGKKDVSDKPLAKEEKKLAQVNGYGKAIEIQALLARQGIQLIQDDSQGESKIILQFEDAATRKTRDKALITLVQSGLMDKNVGLEAFDKGDLTASREEKRIKLIRAQQGELARLIKKIDPIEDASVSIAIPEPSLFRGDEKPMTATVQVTVPSGARLSRDKVRAISNLMVGSLQGLDASHVSISDTNGNTYNSILDAGAEINDKLEEQDNYMKQKVAAQLDRLVGADNYVVTVSTELRQAERETMVQEFPGKSAVSNRQTFNENLSGGGGAGPSAGGFTSSMMPRSLLPPGAALPSASEGAGGGKDYVRKGEEVSYNNSRTQWMETSPIGMLENISIAVVIDSQHFPQDLKEKELKDLLARAASPKVVPDNVSILRSNMSSETPLPNTTAPTESQQDLSWLYWALGAIGFCVLMIVLLSVAGKNKVDPAAGETLLQARQEIQQLREFAVQQQAQLQATQQQTQMILEAQQRQLQQTHDLQQSVQEARNRLPESTVGGIQKTLSELREAVADEVADDESLGLQIKNWIESSP